MGHAAYSVAMGLQFTGRGIQRKLLATEALDLNGLPLHEVALTHQFALEGGMGSLNLQTGPTREIENSRNFTVWTR